MSLPDQPDTDRRETSLPDPPQANQRPTRAMRIVGLIFPVLVLLAIVGYFAARHYAGKAMRDNLPQLDGTLYVPGHAPPFFGLTSPVTVARDSRGVPHISAASLDDLVFAQGYITAQDRLWQMELLRRHAAGELAAILGASMLDHDRLQRTLQLRASADRAVVALPADQLHWLEVYARGVNASVADQRERLPIEFRLLGLKPALWTPRDSLLIELVMFQDLTTGFPVKLGRETLAAHLPPDLLADLYPVGSWRDHPPGAALPDLTSPKPEYEDIPLDKSQSRLRTPTTSPADLLTLQDNLALFHPPARAASQARTHGPYPASRPPPASRSSRTTCTSPSPSPASGTRPTWTPRIRLRSPTSTPPGSPSPHALHHRRPQRPHRLGLHQPRRRRPGLV